MSPFTQAKKNIRKTWLLMGGFLVFVILIGWVFSYIYDNSLILYGAVAFSGVSNIFSFYFSDKVALKISGAKKADPQNETHRRAIRAVENMSIVARIPQPNIYIIDDPAMNAFATGRGPEHASVAVSTGLLNQLDKLELEGVIAHEISHIRNKDILLMTIVVTLVGVIALISDLTLRGAFRGRGNSNKKGGGLILIIGIVFAILSPFAAKIIQLAISRKREFLADASGAEITRHPQGLADALKKISQQGQKMKRAGTATAHLYISNPFGDEKKNRFLGKLFSTHPPIQERISALNGMSGIR